MVSLLIDEPAADDLRYPALASSIVIQPFSLKRGRCGGTLRSNLSRRQNHQISAYGTVIQAEDSTGDASLEAPHLLEQNLIYGYAI